VYDGVVYVPDYAGKLWAVSAGSGRVVLVAAARIIGHLAQTGLALIHGYDAAFWWAAGIFASDAVIAGALLRPGPIGQQDTPRHMPRRQLFRTRQTLPGVISEQFRR
jgi:hypothetical protein